MSSKDKNLSSVKIDKKTSVKGFSFGIVRSEWNDEITSSLLKSCKKTLMKHKAAEEDIYVIDVPGSFELPLGARMLLRKHKLDAVICLGCVIKGETKHDEYINNAVARGIMSLNIGSSKPVIFGVLTPNDMAQAKDRSGGKYGNKGAEAAYTAIKMAILGKDLQGIDKSIGFN